MAGISKDIYVILTVQHLVDLARNCHYLVTMYQTHTVYVGQPSGMISVQVAVG